LRPVILFDAWEIQVQDIAIPEYLQHRNGWGIHFLIGILWVASQPVLPIHHKNKLKGNPDKQTHRRRTCKKKKHPLKLFTNAPVTRPYKSDARVSKIPKSYII